jgi:ATP-dependent DNA helicase HFM1/MER3
MINSFRFGEEYRPVKLEKIVLGFNPAKNDFLFEKALNYKLAIMIRTYAKEK